MRNLPNYRSLLLLASLPLWACFLLLLAFLLPLAGCQRTEEKPRISREERAKRAAKAQREEDAIQRMKKTKTRLGFTVEDFVQEFKQRTNAALTEARKTTIGQEQWQADCKDESSCEVRLHFSMGTEKVIAAWIVGKKNALPQDPWAKGFLQEGDLPTPRVEGIGEARPTEVSSLTERTTTERPAHERLQSADAGSPPEALPEARPALRFQPPALSDLLPSAKAEKHAEVPNLPDASKTTDVPAILDSKRPEPPKASEPSQRPTPPTSAPTATPPPTSQAAPPPRRRWWFW